VVYEVFARKSRGDALRHVGNVTAPNDELARVYAFSTYDEEKWFDMWIAPRDRWVEVFNRQEPASELAAQATAGRKGSR
jgi:1,2-phenylacetyl-CoA epoxidase PaaB subunit